MTSLLSQIQDTPCNSIIHCSFHVNFLIGCKYNGINNDVTGFWKMDLVNHTLIVSLYSALPDEQ